MAEDTPTLPHSGPPPEELLPRRLGDYEIQVLIAKGGMGAVYRARQVSLNRPVALKMIRLDQQAVEESLERFTLEAKVIAALDHPNIIRIYDYGQLGGQPFFTMKLVKGESLAKRFGEYTLSGKPENSGASLNIKNFRLRIRHLIAKVARAVHHAHTLGFLHRDLKPANILLDNAEGEEPEPFVADFGLAKFQQVLTEGTFPNTPAQAAGEAPFGATLSHPNLIVGTPPYMAPEQTLGGQQLSPATDVYALGVILYQLLLGKLPFQAATLEELFHAIRQKPPDFPAGYGKLCGEDLVEVCRRCLSKEPENRLPTALALANALVDPILTEPPASHSAQETNNQPAKLHRVFSPFNEDLAQALFREAGDALFLFDPATGQLIDVNPMAVALSGLTREELLLMRTTDLLKADVEQTMSSLRNAYQQTGNFHAKDGFQLKTRRQGVWIPVNITITRLHLQKRTLGLITARDMRQQREAHDKLKKFEMELRRVLTSVSDCLWSAKLDDAGNLAYRYLSPVIGRITGRQVEYFLNAGHDRWKAIVHPEDRPRWEHTWVLLKRGQSQQHEYRVIHPDGSTHWVRENVQVSPSADLQSLLLDGVVADLTELQATRGALRLAQDDLKRTEAALAQTEAALRQARHDAAAAFLWPHTLARLIGSPDFRAVLDPVQALARVDGDLELFRELVTAYREDGPKLVTDIQEALAVGDANRLEKVVHTIKGVVDLFQALPAYDAALALENLAKAGDLSTAAGAVDHLVMELERLGPALEALAGMAPLEGDSAGTVLDPTPASARKP